MATEGPIVKDQVNVITLKNAKEWHNAFKEKSNREGFAKGDFPPSIVVPFADIEQIVNDFKKEGAPNVNGVRIYFIIKPEVKPNGRTNISAICVPTTGEFAHVRGIDPRERFSDLIVRATLKTHAEKIPDNPGGTKASFAKISTVSGEVEEFSSIYDVTRPCPPYCDPDSPLA